MSVHYNAFISYRHGPLDSKIAAAVQKQLERFRVPKAIAKATGIRKIQRVFRDKDELGMVGELNENIEEALVNAEYLIVICSPATRGSIWVQKEIELFLKTHSPNRVLAVLADGEPEDVVPELLRYREVEMEDDDGVLHTIKVPREALLCDYRLPAAKARREELPRLAAALLGCTYDDLRRRQKQYRNRRIAAAGVAAGVAVTGLAAYYAWSAKQIQENYWQSLYNQSTYLASESQKTLDSGDRLTAMLLAIHALPEEEGDRPVVPAAVKALADATNAYRAPGSNALSLDKSFTHPSFLRGYIPDWERRRLITISYDKLLVWDMDTGEVLFSEMFSDSLMDVCLLPDGDLLVMSNGVSCLRGEDFSVLWRLEDFADHAVVRSDGNILIEQNYQLHLVDGTSGQIIQSANPAELLGRNPYDSYSVEVISPDDRYTAVSVYDMDLRGEIAVVWDLETNEMAENDIPFKNIYSMVFLEDGSLVVSGTSEGYLESMTSINRGAIRHLLFPGRLQVLCMEPDGSTRWMREVTYPQQIYEKKLMTCNYLEQPAIVCAVGNVVEVINPADGAVLIRYEMPAPIVAAETNDVRFRCVLQNGLLGGVTYGSDVPWTQEAFVSSLSRGWLEDLINKGMKDEILVSAGDGNRVLLYRWGTYDETWETIVEDDPKLSNISSRCTTKDGFVCLRDNMIYCYSDWEEKPLWTVELGEKATDWQLRGYLADRDKVALWNVYDQTVRLIDGKTGEFTDRVFSGNVINVIRGGSRLYALFYEREYVDLVQGVTEDGEPWSAYNDYIDTYGLIVMEEHGDTVLQAEVQTNEGIDSFMPNDDKTEVVLWNKEGEYAILSEKGVEYLTGTAKDETVIWLPDGSGFVAAGEKTIRLCDRNLQTMKEISCDSRTVETMKIYDGQLLVVYNTEQLFRYDIKTGEYLGSLDTVGADENAKWDFSVPGQLALHLNKDLNLIDLNSWQLYTHVGDCYAYLPESRTAFVMGYAGTDSYSLGTFQISDHQGLIQRAEAILGGLELTTEQKTVYGIE